jgi:hypothetical protein
MTEALQPTRNIQTLVGIYVCTYCLRVIWLGFYMYAILKFLSKSSTYVEGHNVEVQILDKIFRILQLNVVAAFPSSHYNYNYNYKL